MARVMFRQLNREKFAEFIFDMKECLSADELNRESSCFFIEIPVDLAKEIILASSLTDELREKIMKIIPEDSFGNEEIRLMQKFWGEEVNNLFFEEMNKQMPDCSEEKYICYVTDKMVGSYFEKTNEVVMQYNERKDNGWHTSIVAEEILHLIYWKFWKRLFNKDIGLDERFEIGEGEVNGWSVSETIPDYLLIENPVFEKFSWNKINRAKGYKWLREVRKQLDPIWETKNDFKDFVIKTHEKIGMAVE